MTTSRPAPRQARRPQEIHAPKKVSHLPEGLWQGAWTGELPPLTAPADRDGWGQLPRDLGNRSLRPPPRPTPGIWAVTGVPRPVAQAATCVGTVSVHNPPGRWCWGQPPVQPGLHQHFRRSEWPPLGRYGGSQGGTPLSREELQCTSYDTSAGPLCLKGGRDKVTGGHWPGIPFPGVLNGDNDKAWLAWRQHSGSASPVPCPFTVPPPEGPQADGRETQDRPRGKCL